MKYRYTESSTKASFYLRYGESSLSGPTFGLNTESLLAIAWNRGEDSSITIDEVKTVFPKDTIIPLMIHDSYILENSDDIVLFQFNRDFYCVIDHDQEVSCVGFIFYGSEKNMFIKLDDNNQRKMELLFQTFVDEIEEKDIQGEMLRMLLKRLIIIITRLGKVQYLSNSIDDNESDLIRKYNLLVEQNYKELHQVQDYAGLLNKSPKTLSNIFSKNDGPSPLQVIKNRIAQEAKRLLHYSDMSSKEIAFELGFDDPATFSRFFKNLVGESPTSYKKAP